MTREEAKKHFWYDTDKFGESVSKKFGGIYYEKIFRGYYIGSEIDKFIDKIYDNFESRSCNNCKFCLEDSNDYDVWLECRCPDSPMEYSSVITDIAGYLTTDFCCNKYEQKDK